MKYYQFLLLCMCGVNIACIPATHLPGLKTVQAASITVNTPVPVQTSLEKPLAPHQNDDEASTILVLNPHIQPPIPTPSVIPSTLSQATSSQVSSGSSSSSSGGGSSGSSSNPPEPALLEITDIVLSDTQESILTSKSITFLSGSVSKGSPLKITLKGSFPPATISQENMQFTHEAGLFRQTHEKGDVPSVYVLMDDVLLWNPVNISTQSIELEINSKNLLTFALSGNHTLALITPNQNIEKSIALKIHADDENTSALAPQILSHQLYDEPESEPYLKIVGYHFPLSPTLATVTINQQTYPVIHTQIFTDGRSESFIDLNSAPSLANLEDTFLVYETPFGHTIEKIGSQP